MEHTTINLFDLIVFSVLGLSALMSFFRGFVRELMSLGTWVGASLITLYAFPHVAAMLKPHVNSTMVASGFAGLFTFMGSLIILSVFTSLLLKFVKKGSDIGLLDNGMGLLFGVARGALLVAVAFFIFNLTTTDENYPDWMKGAVTLPYVKDASAFVAKVAPEYLDDISDGEDADKAVDKAVDDAEDEQERIEDNAKENWPSMDDLKEKMNNVKSDMQGGGY